MLNMDFLRKLVPVFLFASCVLLVTINDNRVEASHRIYSRLQSVPAGEVKQLHRTAYHFQPPQHWINGIVLYNILITVIVFSNKSLSFSDIRVHKL